MSTMFDEAEYVYGVSGPPGGATVEQVGDIESRLTEVEGDIEDANDRMDTFPTFNLAGIANGDLLEYNDGELVKHTPGPITIPFSMPIAIGDGTGTVLAMSYPPRGIYMPDDCTITGYVMDADNAITVRVERALAASPTTYATISGSAHPTLSGAGTTGKVTTLTGWTTSIGEGDRLRLLVTGTPVAWSATLNLLLTREV